MKIIDYFNGSEKPIIEGFSFIPNMNEQNNLDVNNNTNNYNYKFSFNDNGMIIKSYYGEINIIASFSYDYIRDKTFDDISTRLLFVKAKIEINNYKGITKIEDNDIILNEFITFKKGNNEYEKKGFRQKVSYYDFISKDFKVNPVVINKLDDFAFKVEHDKYNLYDEEFFSFDINIDTKNEYINNIIKTKKIFLSYEERYSFYNLYVVDNNDKILNITDLNEVKKELADRNKFTFLSSYNTWDSRNKAISLFLKNIITDYIKKEYLEKLKNDIYMVDGDIVTDIIIDNGRNEEEIETRIIFMSEDKKIPFNITLDFEINDLSPERIKLKIDTIYNNPKIILMKDKGDYLEEELIDNLILNKEKINKIDLIGIKKYESKGTLLENIKKEVFSTFPSLPVNFDKKSVFLYKHKYVKEIKEILKANSIGEIVSIIVKKNLMNKDELKDVVFDTSKYRKFYNTIENIVHYKTEYFENKAIKKEENVKINYAYFVDFLNITSFNEEEMNKILNRYYSLSNEELVYYKNNCNNAEDPNEIFVQIGYDLLGKEKANVEFSKIIKINNIKKYKIPNTVEQSDIEKLISLVESLKNSYDFESVDYCETEIISIIHKYNDKASKIETKGYVDLNCSTGLDFYLKAKDILNYGDSEYRIDINKFYVKETKDLEEIEANIKLNGCIIKKNIESPNYIKMITIVSESIAIINDIFGFDIFKKITQNKILLKFDSEADSFSFNSKLALIKIPLKDEINPNLFEVFVDLMFSVLSKEDFNSNEELPSKFVEEIKSNRSVYIIKNAMSKINESGFGGLYLKNIYNTIPIQDISKSAIIEFAIFKSKYLNNSKYKDFLLYKYIAEETPIYKNIELHLMKTYELINNIKAYISKELYYEKKKDGFKLEKIKNEKFDKLLEYKLLESSEFNDKILDLDYLYKFDKEELDLIDFPLVSKSIVKGLKEINFSENFLALLDKEKKTKVEYYLEFLINSPIEIKNVDSAMINILFADVNFRKEFSDELIEKILFSLDLGSTINSGASSVVLLILKEYNSKDYVINRLLEFAKNKHFDISKDIYYIRNGEKISLPLILFEKAKNKIEILNTFEKLGISKLYSYKNVFLLDKWIIKNETELEYIINNYDLKYKKGVNLYTYIFKKIQDSYSEKIDDLKEKFINYVKNEILLDLDVLNNIEIFNSFMGKKNFTDFAIQYFTEEEKEKVFNALTPLMLNYTINKFNNNEGFDSSIASLIKKEPKYLSKLLEGASDVYLSSSDFIESLYNNLSLKIDNKEIFVALSKRKFDFETTIRGISFYQSLISSFISDYEEFKSNNNIKEPKKEKEIYLLFKETILNFIDCLKECGFDFYKIDPKTKKTFFDFINKFSDRELINDIKIRLKIDENKLVNENKTYFEFFAEKLKLYLSGNKANNGVPSSIIPKEMFAVGSINDVSTDPNLILIELIICNRIEYDNFYLKIFPLDMKNNIKHDVDKLTIKDFVMEEEFNLLFDFLSSCKKEKYSIEKLESMFDIIIKIEDLNNKKTDPLLKRNQIVKLKETFIKIFTYNVSISKTETEVDSLFEFIERIGINTNMIPITDKCQKEDIVKFKDVYNTLSKLKKAFGPNADTIIENIDIMQSENKKEYKVLYRDNTIIRYSTKADLLKHTYNALIEYFPDCLTENYIKETLNKNLESDFDKVYLDSKVLALYPDLIINDKGQNFYTAFLDKATKYIGTKLEEGYNNKVLYIIDNFIFKQPFKNNKQNIFFIKKTFDYIKGISCYQYDKLSEPINEDCIVKVKISFGKELFSLPKEILLLEYEDNKTIMGLIIENLDMLTPLFENDNDKLVNFIERFSDNPLIVEKFCLNFLDRNIEEL